MPAGSDYVAVARRGCREIWAHRNGGAPNEELITWVFDQGGPIFGYTGDSGGTEQARIIATEVRRVSKKLGLYGPCSIGTDIEEETAALLAEIVGPFLRGAPAELRVHWMANGSDATECAVRIARAFTQRPGIISIGYHGSSATFAHPPSDDGVLPEAHRSTYPAVFRDDREVARALRFYDIAAVIVEVPPEDEEAQPFLRWLRDETDRHGALLILDEVVTGFRLAAGGAAEFYKARPDLTCYGKAMSNGRGISAVAGRPELMRLLRGPVFASNTFNGDPYNLLHVRATLEQIREGGEELYHALWDIGQALKTALRAEGIKCTGTAVRSVLEMPDERRRDLCARMIPHGIVMDRPNYASLAHASADIAKTAEALNRVLQEEQGE